MATARAVLSLTGMKVTEKTLELRRGETGWEIVVGNSVVRSCGELEWAAFDAILLAEMHGASGIELGAGVPENALALGQALRRNWEARLEE